MAFLLKELVFLGIVAMVFTFPWKPYEIVHDPSIVQEDFPQPLNDGTDATVDSAVDEHPPDSGQEVYPVDTNTKRGTGDTVLDSAIDEHPPDSGEEVYPVENNTKRALFYDSNDRDPDFDENKKTRVRRGAVLNTKYLWPGYNTPGDVYIPYVIGDVSSDTKKWLELVINELAEDTCIKFRTRTGEKYYVKFITGAGCSSDIGYRSGKIQNVILGQGCQYKGTIAHEIMHLLGFYHEHTRQDRDQYIEVNFKNIQDGLDGEFTTRNQNNLGKPYDKFSIMQYASDAFTVKSGLKSMVSKRDSNEKLGQIANMDAKDLEEIIKLYKCPEKKFKDHIITLKTEDSWLAGTDGDVYVRFVGTTGKTRWHQITYGGRLGDENERGAIEEHHVAFEDVGDINEVYLVLTATGAGPPADKKRSIETAEKTKRWFTGWTAQVEVDGKDYKSVDLDVGDKPVQLA